MSDKNGFHASQQGMRDWSVFPTVRRLTGIGIRAEVAQLQVSLEFGRQSDWECCAQQVHKLVILESDRLVGWL